MKLWGVCVCGRLQQNSIPNCLVARSSQLFVTPWTVARQALLSVGFPRQEYWSGLPFQGNGNPLQYSCLENPTDRGAW